MNDTDGPIRDEPIEHEELSLGEEPASVQDSSEISSPVEYDPKIEEVIAELDRQDAARRSWQQNLVTLLLSLSVFALVGVFSFGAIDLVLVVVVLLIHESGHYIGMRLYNYQNVQMFFIPFFGAAVAGRTSNVPAYQQAIVYLLGPLPGIGIGLVLGISCLFYPSDLLRQATTMFLLLNGFNLLPFLPLDGGRLLHLVLFSRQKHIEAAFRLGTGLVLGAAGWFFGFWVLAFLGALILLATGYGFRISSAAQELRQEMDEPPGEVADGGKLPRETAALITEKVRESFAELEKPKAIANAVRTVWERVQTRPPSIPATAALLTTYGMSFVAAPVGFLALMFWPTSQVIVHPNQDGTITRRQEDRMGGRLTKVIGLSRSGLYDGNHVEYFPGTNQLAVQGKWKEGYRHGEWKRLDQNGNLVSLTVYDNGQFIRHKKKTGADWKTYALQEMPQEFRAELSLDLTTGPHGAQ